MDKAVKVKDLIVMLTQCEPEAAVKIMLDGALLYDDEEPGEVDYGFEPIIECLSSKSGTDPSECVYFLLSQEDTARLVKTRREQSRCFASEPELDTSCNPAIALEAPVAVAVAMNRDVYTNLIAVVESCNHAHNTSKGATTHGRLDIPGLLQMLAEDAAMTNSRPGSWEGANLQQVLDSHGYY